MTFSRSVSRAVISARAGLGYVVAAGAPGFEDELFAA